MSTLLEQPAPTIPVGRCISDTTTVFEPHPFVGRQYTPNYRTLCSIFPEQVIHHMMHAGGRKEYKFPAVPKGSYALLRVYDTWTLTRDLARAAGASDGEDEEGYAMTRSPVHCDGVASDLLRAWTQDAPGNASGAKPGIMVLARDEPSQLELNSLDETQTTYFRWLVMKADEYWITGKREYITEDHRRALRWLGSEDRDWYKKIQAVLLKRCPACAEEINQLATVCRFCQANIVKFYKDLAMDVTEDVDAGVYQFLKMQDERKGLAKMQAEKERLEAANAKLRSAFPNAPVPVESGT